MSNIIGYIDTIKAAAMLGKTTRRIVGLCREGKIAGAVKEGKNWRIPEDSVFKYMKETGIDAVSDKGLLPCAVGNTSYVEIATECYYVDKTLLIKDLIDDHNVVTLFTRPRRFGKTLAVNMLKTYFEKANADTSKYFQDKKIWQCGEKYRALQGAFPVIMLTFKDVKYNNWKDSLEAIRLVIKDEFKRHSELSESELLKADDKDFLARMEKGLLSDVELNRSLLILSRMLATHHNKQVVILIDEYDTPMQQGYSRGYYKEIVSFMRNFLSGGLKDNPDLAFGVLTGIMRISKENLFSGLNNLTVNSAIDDRYSKYFGFTEEEVTKMAAYYGKTECLNEIRKWYDGYRFGDTEIFNPWSVSNYFANGGKAKAFWANTSDNEIIREILQSLTPEVADELSRIMQDEKIHTALNMEVVYPKMADGADTIFSFLLLAGYLTLTDRPEETEFGTFATLKLPNMEIRRVYNTEVLGWMKTKAGGGVVTEIEKAMYLNDEDRLQKALRQYMVSSISYFDGADEGFYHGMVLGLVATLSSRYYIRSNRESGDGRYDLMFEPREKSLPGIIMEFKSVESSRKEELEKLSADALDQIDRLHYSAELKERGVNKIIKYGIAFSGKNVEVMKK